MTLAMVTFTSENEMYYCWRFWMGNGLLQKLEIVIVVETETNIECSKEQKCDDHGEVNGSTLLMIHLVNGR